MKVYVSPDVESLKGDLILEGYNVIDVLDKCDIILCDLKKDNNEYFNEDFLKKNEGILVIDAAFRKLEDIECIIREKH